MISGFWLLMRHYSGHLPEKKDLCSFIISTLSRLTYLLLHRLLLSTSLHTPYFLLFLSLLLLTSLLNPSLLTTYSFLLLSLLLPTSLLTTSLLTPYSLPLLSFLLTTSLLTTHHFSPYSFPAFSSNLSTSHCSCWAMVSCPLSSSMASSALRNGLTSR